MVAAFNDDAEDDIIHIEQKAQKKIVSAEDELMCAKKSLEMLREAVCSQKKMLEQLKSQIVILENLTGKLKISLG